MKKFLWRTFLFAAPVLGVVVLVNYRIDPANVFAGGGLEKRAAMILLRGEHVAGLVNYDERLLQREFISGLEKRPQTVVLGSSRGMLIDRRNGRDSSLVNSSVSGARLEDMIAIYQLYEDHHIEPQRVIIELSPYMFNGTYRDRRYQTLNAEYRRGAASVCGQSQGLSLGTYAKNLEIVSLSYFQSAVRALGNNAETDTIFATADSVTKTHLIKFPDGSIAYSEDYRNNEVTAADIRIAVDYGNGENFRTLSEERQKTFELFVAYLRDRGVQVEFFLAPLPNEVCGRRPVFKEVEAYVSAYAARQGIPVRGSYDCDTYNLTLSDFYDGLHPRKEIYDSIMNN